MMDISKMVSTVILVTAFATTFLFAFLFYLFGDLKDALSDTASFFGGIATLVAAYLGTKLFIDWKVVERFKRTNEMLDRINLEVSIIYKDLTELLVQSQKLNNNGFCRKETSQNIRHKILKVITYIALDHEKLVKSNKYINDYFVILNHLNDDYKIYRDALKGDLKNPQTNFTTSNLLLKNCLREFSKALDDMLMSNLR